jgi:hypothetical protein
MSYRGFKTTQGSVYARDDLGQVVRFLNASPHGALLDRPDLCLFAPPAAIADIDAHYLGRENCRVIDICMNAASQAVLRILERDKVISARIVELQPAIGFVPVEKSGNETRIGEPIIEIYSDENGLKISAPDHWHDAAQIPARRALVQALRILPPQV